MEQRDRAMNVSQEVRTGVLFMVDLAGSERAAVTQVGTKNQFLHGPHIVHAVHAVTTPGTYKLLLGAKIHLKVVEFTHMHRSCVTHDSHSTACNCTCTCTHLFVDHAIFTPL